MANVLEKVLPEQIRNNMRTLIAGALGLFLGLMYNDYFKKLLAKVVPESSGLLGDTAIIIVVTVLIVYASIALHRALDGK